MLFQNPDGTSALEVWENDGYFMCSFTQELSLVIPNQKTFDLEEEHFLLVAAGTISKSVTSLPSREDAWPSDMFG